MPNDTFLPDLGRQPGVHRRPASAQHLLGHVGPSDVRQSRCAGADPRAEGMPQGLWRPLHPPGRLRCQPWLGVGAGFPSSSTGPPRSPATGCSARRRQAAASATRPRPTRPTGPPAAATADPAGPALPAGPTMLETIQRGAGGFSHVRTSPGRHDRNADGDRPAGGVRELRRRRRARRARPRTGRPEAGQDAHPRDRGAAAGRAAAPKNSASPRRRRRCT